MKEYTTLFLKEKVPNFETVTTKRFEESLNTLANQGWTIKSSGFLAISTEKAEIAAYAILEREKP